MSHHSLGPSRKGKGKRPETRGRSPERPSGRFLSLGLENDGTVVMTLSVPENVAPGVKVSVSSIMVQGRVLEDLQAEVKKPRTKGSTSLYCLWAYKPVQFSGDLTWMAGQSYQGAKPTCILSLTQTDGSWHVSARFGDVSRGRGSGRSSSETPSSRASSGDRHSEPARNKGKAKLLPSFPEAVARSSSSVRRSSDGSQATVANAGTEGGLLDTDFLSIGTPGPSKRRVRKLVEPGSSQLAPTKPAGVLPGAPGARTRSPQTPAATIGIPALTGLVSSARAFEDVQESGSAFISIMFVVRIWSLKNGESMSAWTRDNLKSFLSTLKGHDGQPIATLQEPLYKDSKEKYEDPIQISIHCDNVSFSNEKLAKRMWKEMAKEWRTKDVYHSEQWRTGRWGDGLLGSPVRLVRENDHLVFRLDNSRSNVYFTPFV